MGEQVSPSQYKRPSVSRLECSIWNFSTRGARQPKKPASAALVTPRDIMPPLDKELTGGGVGFHLMPTVPDNAGILYDVRRFVVGVEVAGVWTTVVQVGDCGLVSAGGGGIMARLSLRLMEESSPTRGMTHI